MKLKLSVIKDYTLAMTCCMSSILLAYINNTLYKVLMVIFCLCAFVRCIKKGSLARNGVIFLQSWLPFVLWSILSIAWSYRRDNIDVVLVLILIGMTCFSVCVFVNTEEQVYIYFRSIIVSAIVLEIYIFSYYDSSIFTERFDNEVLNSNRAGVIFALAVLLCVYLYDCRRKFILLISATFLSLGVLLSGSKAAIFFVLISLGIFIIFKNKENFLLILRNVAIVICLLIIIYEIITRVPGLYDIIGNRLIEFINNIFGTSITSRSTLMRSYLIETAWQCFKQNPLVGYGINNFKYMNIYGTYAHSNLFDLLADVGLVGVLLFYRIYYMIIRRIKKNKHILNFKKIFVGAYMCGMLFRNIVGVYYNQMIDIVVACLVFLLINMQKEE